MTEPMNGAQLIAAERERQVTAEGWSSEHDDEHDSGEILEASRAYIYTTQTGLPESPWFWPWEEDYWQPSTPILNLVKAGALIAAEIDRLQRKGGEATEHAGGKGMSGWIGVDLDGTLAIYDRWVSEEHIGEPIAPMVERVKRWRSEGREVRIFTARVDGGNAAILLGDANGERFRDVQRIKGFIEAWCLKHLGEVLPITNIKDYGMIELWDDRCVQVIANTGQPVGQSTRGLD